jgi:hypothetical protein
MPTEVVETDKTDALLSIVAAASDTPMQGLCLLCAAIMQLYYEFADPDERMPVDEFIDHVYKMLKSAKRHTGPMQ